jgi:hypothetical protein
LTKLTLRRDDAELGHVRPKCVDQHGALAKEQSAGSTWGTRPGQDMTLAQKQEARRRRADGESVADLARSYGDERRRHVQGHRKYSEAVFVAEQTQVGTWPGSIAWTFSLICSASAFSGGGKNHLELSGILPYIVGRK